MKALAPDDPRVIGEYRLRAQLGAGGMGRVYLGLSPAGRAVAIKVVNPDLADDAGGAGPGGGAEDTLRLTPTEWRILEVLLRRPGQLVASAQILTAVWGPGFGQRTNYLRFHMARLRRKLEDNPARPRHLLTEPGMGYRYQP